MNLCAVVCRARGTVVAGAGVRDIDEGVEVVILGRGPAVLLTRGAFERSEAPELPWTGPPPPLAVAASSSLRYPRFLPTGGESISRARVSGGRVLRMPALDDIRGARLSNMAESFLGRSEWTGFVSVPADDDGCRL